MIDLLGTLIDRLIDLAKVHQENNEKVYLNFVAPAFDDFEAVHKDYLESFQRYRDMIADPNSVMSHKHPIFDIIAKDRLFSQGLKAKVVESFESQNDPLLGSFIKSIKRYIFMVFQAQDHLQNKQIDLQDAESEATAATFATPRAVFSGLLGRAIQTAGIASSIVKTHAMQERMRADALKSLDAVVEQMQVNYGEVVHEHAILKRKLLQPK